MKVCRGNAFFVILFIFIADFALGSESFEKTLNDVFHDVTHQAAHLNFDSNTKDKRNEPIEVKIREIHASNAYKNDQNNDHLPESLHVTFGMKGSKKRVLLKLKRNPRVEMNTPVVLMKNNKAIRLAAEAISIKNAAAYQDVEKGGVFNVWTVPMPEYLKKMNKNSKSNVHSRYYVGSFMHEGQQFVMSPRQDHLSLFTKRSNIGSRFNSITHVVRRARDIYENYHHFIKRFQEEPNFNNQGLGKNEFVEGMYKIELRILVDYTVFLYWMRRSGNNIDMATKNIKYTFAHITNGADMVYRRMKKIELGIYLLEYTIFSTSKDSWPSITSITNRKLNVEDPNQNLRKIPANAEGILDKIGKWIEREPDHRRADHVSLMTMMDISEDTVGLAWMERTCMMDGVSVIEISGLDSWTTLAHEMGHSLGADHDGENGCTDEQYIMGAFVAQYDDESIKRGYRFSECSEEQIYYYVTGSNGKCLSTADYGEHSQPNDYVDVLPGLKYSLDEQCDLRESGTKWTASKFSICSHLECNGRYIDGLRAAIGSPCGDKMWCRAGVCTHDDNAPSLPGGVGSWKGTESLVSNSKPRRLPKSSMKRVPEMKKSTQLRRK